MEAQKPPGSAAAPPDCPVPAPALQPPRGSSDAPEQALAQPVYLKALTIPLYQPVQAGCFQPHGHVVAARSCVHLDGSNIPLILNPLVPPEGPDQPRPGLQKQLGQSLTLSIVSTLPVLPSPGSCVSVPLGSPGRSKKAGKYICKHCGRDCLKPSVLEKHIRSHTGERPFPCTTCGIAFKTQSNLYKHRRTQTHVNNTRLPSDCDISGLSEPNERSAESSSSPQGSKLLSSTGEDRGVQMKQLSSEPSAGPDTKTPHELSLPATSTSPVVSENHESTNQSFSSKANQGVPEREPHSLPSPGALPSGPRQRKKMQEQRTPTDNKHVQLQRQQATSSEKQWDYKPSECKLKKCESTDSGYLSRSDSTEQQMASPSPLHSLCEHSTELESESAFSSPRCAKPEAADKATASMLEKKRLEEHISKLISHNKSVVDDTHLDNVRPRKTVLSKQGSIDLPMPYTYKDSFHFDIRTCDVNRKKNLALCSAKSTFAPLEKCKPMFFHSVPTQFSTTIDTVPVTRSNSLPFVEGARMGQDKPGCSKPLCLTKQSGNTGTAGLLPSNNLAANSVDFPNSHPRALVRQTAVDDLPLSNVVDHPPPSEELQGSKRLGAGEVISAKNKKHNQRKLKMFSQEKWQMYGDETFKKIYQKMKSSQNAKKMKQRGTKITDITSLPPDSKQSASSTEITEERDGRSSVSDSHSSLVTAASNTGKSGTCTDGNSVLQSVSSEDTADRVSYLMETSHSINAGTQAVRSKPCRAPGSRDTEKCTAGSSTGRAPSTCELSLQNPECQPSSHRRNDDSLPAQRSNWENPSSGKESSTSELDCKSTTNDYGNHRRTKETGQHGLWVRGNNRQTAGKSQNLPSERKKLKFESQTVISMSCPSPGSETSAASEAEICSGTPCLSTAPVTLSSISTSPVTFPSKEEQKLSTGINESTGGTENVEYVKTIKLPTRTLDYSDGDPLSHSTGISKASLVGVLGPELRGKDCNSFALHNAADKDDKSHLVKTGAKAPLFNDNTVDLSSKINPLQSGHLTPVSQQNAFSPKYILKLPQDKRASNVSLLPRSAQIPPRTSETDTVTTPSCSSSSGSLRSHPTDVVWSPSQSEVRQKAAKGELRWNAHTNSRKTPGFCSAVNPETTDILTTADNSCYDQNFRQRDMAKDDWKNKQNKNKLNYQRQTEKWMSITAGSTQTPKKKICFTSVYTSGFFISADIRDEGKVLHHLCSGSDSLIQTSASSKGAEPGVEGWDRGGGPCALKDISSPPQDTQPSQSSTDNPTYFCHSFGTFYCRALTTHCKEFPVLPHNNQTCSSGSLSGTKGTFPSLSAEPRLTWCCLSRSLPVPVEQKGSAHSAHSSALSCHRGSSSHCPLSKHDMPTAKKKNISETVACGFTNTGLKTLVSSFSKGQQVQELSSAAPGGAFKNISEQKKKTVVCKKEKLSTNKLKRSHKQKKIKATPKWYRGRHVHGYAQLKVNRLSKRPCFPNRALDALRKGCSSQPPRFNKHRKCHSPQAKVQENYLHQQNSTSDKPLCRRKKEGKNNSGIPSHTEKLNHVKQKDKMDKKEQTREHTGTTSSVLDVLAPPGTAVRADSAPCPSPTSTMVHGDITLGCGGTRPPELQHSQHSLRSHSTAPSFGSCPAGFTNTGTGDQPTSTNPAGLPSLRLEASRENTPSVESESQAFGMLDPAVQASGREKPPAGENRYSPPKANSAPSSQPGCSRLFGSKAESLPESATGAPLPGGEHPERADRSHNLQDLHGSTHRNGSHLQPNPYGRPHGTAATPFKKPPVSIRSPEFKSYSATPSKTYKKRGLEMMRKQTRVEYDDTSSDDEDRLVIEI